MFWRAITHLESIEKPYSGTASKTSWINFGDRRWVKVSHLLYDHLRPEIWMQTEDAFKGGRILFRVLVYIYSMRIVNHEWLNMILKIFFFCLEIYRGHCGSILNIFFCLPPRRLLLRKASWHWLIWGSDWPNRSRGWPRRRQEWLN